MTAKLTVSDDEIWKFFKELLHEGDVEVRFEKKDGTDRVMKCTLRPEAYEDYEFQGGGTHNDDVLSVWDLEKDAWRSIRKGTLIEVQHIDK